MTNLEKYIREAESTGSKHCVVDTETLRALFDVAEAARCLIQNSGEVDKKLYRVQELQTALTKLDEARRG